MKIKEAKGKIVYEVATNGEVTREAMRTFIEHRISKATFDELVKVGLRKYNEVKK